MVSEDRTRRRVLKTGAAAVLGTLSGCSYLQSDGPPEGNVQFDPFLVTNWHTEPHDIGVQILADGEPVYWRNISLEGANEGESRSAGETLDDIPEDIADYEVRTRLQEWAPGRWEWASFSGQKGCILAEIMIGSPGVWDSSSLVITSSSDCYRGKDWRAESPGP